MITQAALLPVRRNSSLGFTLIELIGVISIIGILAAIILANLGGIQGRARDAQRKSDFNAIQKALQLYYNDNNKYPAGGWYGDCPSCTPNTWITFLSPTYIKQMPKDPKGNGQDDRWPWYGGFSYAYAAQCTSDSSYLLVAQLENQHDSALGGAANHYNNTVQTGCSSWSGGLVSGATDTYTVSSP